MPSPRRMRLLMGAVLGTVVLILFYTSGTHDDRDMEARSLHDFYQKTVKAMDKGSTPGPPLVDPNNDYKQGAVPFDRDADGDIDEDDKRMAVEMQGRLKAAEQAAKDKANEKAGLRPDPPHNVVGVGSSAEGQVKKDAKDAADAGSSKVVPKETQEEHEAELELGLILKKAPVIIFSKSYCPFSKRAKGLLLEKYSITPDPFVVELDEHPLGPHLQDQLQERTGRRTVPNIMINGISIGGADDIIALDNDGKLVDKVIELGNKRVDMVERLAKSNVHA